jgi:hypothetical protein
LAVAAALAAFVGCQTITEEMPNRPDPVPVGGSSGGGGPVPIVVVPVPIPQPRDPAPAPTTPNPTPTSNPNPNPGPGIPPNIPNNNSPVAKVGAKVYFVEVNGELVPGSENASSAPFNSRIHFDCTPKDGANQPTQANGTPQWTFSPDGLASISGRSAYNPVATPRGTGTLSAYVTIDGVRSNTVSININ